MHSMRASPQIVVTIAAALHYLCMYAVKAVDLDLFTGNRRSTPTRNIRYRRQTQRDAKSRQLQHYLDGAFRFFHSGSSVSSALVDEDRYALRAVVVPLIQKCG